MEQSTKTAFLVMDMQLALLSHLPDHSALVANVKKAIVKAREYGMPVIHVVQGFRPGAPEVGSGNKLFSNFVNKEHWTAEFAAQFLHTHPDLAPQADDIIVVKRRVSAFSGSDLEVILRAQDIRHLVMTGIATSGVVLSTLREAADKDYQIVVIEDCCADNDEEVHRLLMEKIFSRQAEVLDLNTWIN
ncbi:nicotinamidase-related amidase [Mucilaginibacter gracilis]|uniref:Nicotinamidase-related amidase n=1 Tax=Mucilaginibacter gracilis TaxID=423350 RepID=A0A495J6M5_9SPHI|nr:isochorismatase family cysteine hydrolase [Mucilaginibacter gracilis]RKR84640.1 nicotinamidase-related amidase [Mucilaginibacter gracilis]